MGRRAEVWQLRAGSVAAGSLAREVANLFRLGVWRSLVARSVRVGEVPSSNLGTPMKFRALGRVDRRCLRPGILPRYP